MYCRLILTVLFSILLSPSTSFSLMLVSSSTYPDGAPYVRSMAIGPDNNIYLGGSMSVSGNSKWWIGKFTKDLVLLSSSAFEQGEVMGLRVDSTGKVYATGGFITPQQVLFLCTLTSNLTVISSVSYSGTMGSSNIGEDVVYDSVGNIYSLGMINTGGKRLAKYSSNFVFISSIALSASYARMEIDQSNNLYLTGYSGGNPYYIATAKYNSSLTLVSSTTFSSPNNIGFGNVLKLDSLSNFLYVSGTVNSTGGGQGTPWIGKYNAQNLSLVSSATLAVADSRPYGIAFDSNGNIYAGISTFYNSQLWGLTSNLVSIATVAVPSLWLSSVDSDSPNLVYGAGTANYNGGGASAFWLGKFNFVPAPADNLHSSTLGTSSITWSWNGTSDSNGYRIISEANADLSGDLSYGTLNWTETGLAPGTSYNRRVVSYNSYGASTSTVVYGYTTSIPIPPTVSPGWVMQNVEPGSPTGYYGTALSIALDSANAQHILYGNSSGVRYAKRNAQDSSWQTQNIEGPGSSPISISVDSSNNPQIIYSSNTYLRYGKWNGSSWVTQTISSGVTVPYGSMVLDASGNPHIVFSSTTVGGYSTKYIRWTGTLWQEQEVDNEGGCASSIALTPIGQPLIVYSAMPCTSVKYAKWTGVAWSTQTVDAGRIGGLSSKSIAVSSLDSNPSIIYLGIPEGLVYGKWTGTAWSTQTVDANGWSDMSLELDSNNNPHIAYHASGIKYVKWTGSSWETETVVAPTDNRLAFDLNAQGVPYILYEADYDISNGALRYVYKSTCSIPSPASALAAESIGSERITISWDPSPSSGIYQYKVYYDNGSGTIDYDTPYAVLTSTVTSWTTAPLTSGVTYRFGLRTKNSSGLEESNTSLVTSAVALSALTGVRTSIKVPQSGKMIKGNRVTVIAEPILGNISQIKQVLFQYRLASGGAWTSILAANANHPNPDLESPYLVHWDVDALGVGAATVYELRAVATSLSDVADSAPPTTTVTIVPSVSSDYDVNENLVSGVVQKDQKINNAISNTIQAADEGSALVAKVQIPSGAINDSTITITVVNNPTSKPPSPPGVDDLGILTKVDFSNGQSLLAGGKTATVALNYTDSDGDGVVDGTIVKVDKLRVHTASSLAGPWVILPSNLDNSKKTVTGTTTHFSFFALFAPLASDLSSVEVYPVPFKPNDGNADTGVAYSAGNANSGIIFDSLPASVSVKVYTVTGQLVAKFGSTASSGKLQWDVKNDSGKPVASGVYVAVISSPGQKDVVKKIMVVR